MKITIVTDHRFFNYGDEMFDDYVFDYNFFKNYLDVFDKVDIVCRVQKMEVLDNRWVKSSGPGINFISLPNEHGLNWFLNINRYIKEELLAIFDTDSFCFRLPSMAAWEIFCQNKSRNLPYIFESIGDPEDAMISSEDSLAKRVPIMVLGHILKNRKRKIVYHAVTGSYVSIKHLQQKYPIKEDKITESISSIRLESRYILKRSKIFDFKKSIRIIHIGSFIPLKNQKDLIQAFKIISAKYPQAKLDFVGDGPTSNACEQFVKKLGLSSEVVFHGQVTGFNNIVKLLDKAQFFILPSFNEGMPRALIEAMARGLICLGSNRGGISELLDEEYLFTVGDYQQIANKLTCLINNYSTEELGQISLINIDRAKEFENGILQNKRYKLLKSLREIL
ncbi:Glycosyltransferase involved in cell wall bisynthesis [Salegentibacter agarivorans]|uniref:Glycosyltransferase involved in cell wall bisynthesis n=1 Tax=Salegentibacter agarivorans TaxID=345907 RepID=A0A1I2LD36_9FLAO|nr:glycosyltransferase [Salegentibacter agarivorans]SFF77165.1 Glycosyltransferase involved in cell wall bisynthesis [Salegentibacter agarivorans]